MSTINNRFLIGRLSIFAGGKTIIGTPIVLPLASTTGQNDNPYTQREDVESDDYWFQQNILEFDLQLPENATDIEIRFADEINNLVSTPKPYKVQLIFSE